MSADTKMYHLLELLAFILHYAAFPRTILLYSFCSYNRIKTSSVSDHVL